MLKLTVDAKAARLAVIRDMSQLRKAVSKALTGLAYDVRDGVRASLPNRFTIRRPWVAKGIGVAPASASTLTATVFSRDRFMEQQETGGTKSGRLSIPVGRMAAIARTKVLPKSLWPRALRSRRNVFVRNGKVFERRGKQVGVLYLLRRRQRVRPRFGMAMQADRISLVNQSKFSRRIFNSI